MKGVNVQVMSSRLPYWWSMMRRVTLTQQTLDWIVSSEKIHAEWIQKGWDCLREAHCENSSQDEFLGLASSQTPKNWYGLNSSSIR